MKQDFSSKSGAWFSTKKFRRGIDLATWDLAVSLFIAQKVSSITVEQMGNTWEVSGRVQDNSRRSYEVRVDLLLTDDDEVDDWEGVCTCDSSEQCRHAVALMIAASQHGLRLMGVKLAAVSKPVGPTPVQIESERKAAQTRAQEASRHEAENQLLRWFNEFDRVSGTARLARQHLPIGQPGAPKVKTESYLYLLSVQGLNTTKPTLQLEAVVSYVKQNGEWAKFKPLRQVPYEALYDQATALDHEVLQLLGTMEYANRYKYNYTAMSAVGGTPQGRAGLFAIEQAAETGRLFVYDDHSGSYTRITWGESLPLQWNWYEVASPKTGEMGWSLRASMADGNAVLCLNNPPLYLNVALGRCGLVQCEGLSASQIEVLRNVPALKQSAMQQHQGELMLRLGKLPAPPVLTALTVLHGVVPIACLHISPTADCDREMYGLIQVQFQFDYQGHRGWWAGQGDQVLLQGADRRILLHRDTAVELDFIGRLAALGVYQQSGFYYGIPNYKSQQNWLQWADDDFAVFSQAGFTVTVDPALQGWISRAQNLDVQLVPEQGEEAGAGAEGDAECATSPWFDLSLGMEINGQRYNILPLLPELIAQAAATAPDALTGLPNLPPFVYLPSVDGKGFIRLPTETLKPWMAALLELVGERLHDFAGESLRLSRLDAMRTTASLGEGAVWEGALALRKMVRQLSGIAEISEVPVPPSVQASLRPYQLQGLNWLQFLREHNLAGILADDMGLGKTVQTLVHIQVEKDAGRLKHPVLIIAPVSLLGNWKREAQRFCPQLSALVIHGKDRHEVSGTLDQHDLVIAPYSLLQRDRERWLQAKWHLVVLDEAQNIKNASTQAAQVASQLQTGHRLCLSGTPMENHLGEIWSLFHFLMPGFLGSHKRFSELFRTPIEKQGNPERMIQLRARITPFMLRRTKALVAHELPPKVETVMRVELSGKQADLYETIRLGMEKTVREALSTKGLAKSQITILDALLKLRQVCCDPRLIKLDAAQKVNASAKLEQLMELIPEMLAEGRRILLFSQFTSMLRLIEAELAKRHLKWVKLTGQSQERDALIEQFTSGQVPLFLISLKAGGVGLNLPQADTVIHYDPWWNPAVENQATDRAHRIGQTHSVWVVKLVAQGTIEERILALQERKAALADSMYSGSTARKQPLFTENDLAELLKPLSAS